VCSRRLVRYLTEGSPGQLEREDAKHFIEEVRGDDPELAWHLRIEERELDAGGLT
jgi:hypothetical protein